MGEVDVWVSGAWWGWGRAVRATRAYQPRLRCEHVYLGIAHLFRVHLEVDVVHSAVDVEDEEQQVDSDVEPADGGVQPRGPPFGATAKAGDIEQQPDDEGLPRPVLRDVNVSERRFNDLVFGQLGNLFQRRVGAAEEVEFRGGQRAVLSERVPYPQSRTGAPHPLLTFKTYLMFMSFSYFFMALEGFFLCLIAAPNEPLRVDAETAS